MGAGGWDRKVSIKLHVIDWALPKGLRIFFCLVIFSFHQDAVRMSKLAKEAAMSRHDVVISYGTGMNNCKLSVDTILQIDSIWCQQTTIQQMNSVQLYGIDQLQ